MYYARLDAKTDLSVYPEAIQKALLYCLNTDFSTMADGRHEIDGDRMFASVWHGTTKKLADSTVELHKQYIDVQYWLDGEEICGAAPADGVGPLREAHEDRDLYLYDSVKYESMIHMGKGCFGVFFPWDAHRPGVAVNDEPSAAAKVVVKVSVDLLK